MTTFKHTPGPWMVSKNGAQGSTFLVWRTDTDQPQGDDFRNRGYALITKHVHGEANARLIAAAPELLEALRYALDRLEATLERLPDTQENALWEQEAVKDFDKARAAIAKAEGKI